MSSCSILSVCTWTRRPQIAKWCKFIDQYIFNNFVYIFSHYQRTSAKLHWELCTPTTRPFHASSGRRLVSASSVRDALSTMTPMRRDASSIRCQIFQRASLYHLCQRNWKKHATIINIRIIITTTILEATVTIPLISLAIIHTSSIFHPTSTWATILASKTQWFK